MGYRAFHQLDTFSMLGPPNWNEAAPSSFTVGLAANSFTILKSKPIKLVATVFDDDGLLFWVVSASFDFIARGW
jgi:hypothetical protein